MRARLAAAAAALVIAGGWVAADATDAVPGPLTTRRAVPEPEPYPRPTAAPAAVPTVAADPAPTPVGDLQGLVDALESDLGTVSVNLVDAATGSVVGAAQPLTPRTPASSLKILTAAAALEALGPEHTLVTTATWDGTTVTLVGGGDLLLGVGEPAVGAPGHASLTDLAAQVADGLGPTTVTLAVDDTLFAGPTRAADWLPLDDLFVMPMAALAIDAGRVGTGLEPDPAMAAARAFAAELGAAGVAVRGEPVRAGSAPGATTVGLVESAPLAEIVRHMLKVSENSLAEALGRLVSLALGGPGSAEDATAAVLTVVSGLGVPTAGAVLRDTSGLASTSAVTTELLTDVVLASLDPGHPRLTGLVGSLPVAGLDGTLADRLDGAAGRVRAKTGTLLTVVSLTGMVRTGTGGAVVFSVVVPQVPEGGVAGARERVDRFVTAVAAGSG